MAIASNRVSALAGATGATAAQNASAVTGAHGSREVSRITLPIIKIFQPRAAALNYAFIKRRTINQPFQN